MYLLLNVFGGLAIFIFGMKLMSDGLQMAAGDKMRSILKLFSANRFVAILSGTAVTAVVQSSSASTVMVIGFVNAGLLSLIQAIGIIFGSNIGTTITAQLVAFEISWIIMPAIILGLLMSFAQRPAFKAWGETLMGLGFLFLGMQYMSDELKLLSSNQHFIDLFRTFDCAPIDGAMPISSLLGAILIGLVATIVIQSSSACTGIVLALGASGLVNLYTAVAIVLGSNIGTTITAQLAALPANRIAKQAALAHTLFNVIGVLVVTSTFWIDISGVPAFFKLIDWISLDGDLPRKIANAHTVFNIFTTLILIPFIPLLARVCERIIPLSSDKVKYLRLEPKLLDTPPIALIQTSDALRRMLKKAWRMVDCALNIYNKNDSKNQKLLAILDEKEQRVDKYQQDITNYLSELMLRPLSAQEADTIPLLLHCTNDAERIGDHTFIIKDFMNKLLEQECKLSKEAEEEFSNLHSLLENQVQCALKLLEKPDAKTRLEASELKVKINSLTDEYEKHHLNRLAEGKCQAPAGVVFIGLISEIKKISRHLANITDRTSVSFSKQSATAVNQKLAKAAEQS